MTKSPMVFQEIGNEQVRPSNRSIEEKSEMEN